jgi:multicomponent Na+:H+ antiporter subunit F
MSAVAIACLGVALVLAAIALAREKGAADRLVIVDALSAFGIGACLLAAAHTGHPAFLDVAIGFALVAFVATLGWASMLAARRDGGGQ